MGAKKSNIIFVCTGNVCRSPMAEALFLQKINNPENFSVKSAGIMAAENQPPSQNSTEVMQEIGIDIRSLRSSMLTEDMMNWATHLFVMSQSHKTILEKYYPQHTNKIYLLCEFCPEDELRGHNIPDPIGMNIHTYRQTRDVINKALDSILKFIEQTQKN